MRPRGRPGGSRNGLKLSLTRGGGRKAFVKRGQASPGAAAVGGPGEGLPERVSLGVGGGELPAEETAPGQEEGGRGWRVRAGPPLRRCQSRLGSLGILWASPGLCFVFCDMTPTRRCLRVPGAPVSMTVTHLLRLPRMSSACPSPTSRW